MCLNKLYIKNPKLIPTSLDKPAISVDCGHCSECAKNKSNDWFVRTYYEVFTGEPKDLFLITLDFDDQHLPVYNLIEHKIQHFNDFVPLSFDFNNLPNHLVPCFDNLEMSKFFDRLHYYLPNFKYLCVAEYGGFLRRPHHHILLICNKSSLYRKTFVMYAVSRCWSFGSHYDVQSVSHCSDDPLKMIRYIVPYTTKDFSFDLDRLTQLPNRCRPRILNSGHFGKAPVLDGRITFDTVKNVGFVLINNVKYKIPRYYEQYFTNDYVWDSEQKKAFRPLNELGRELSQFRHNRRYVYYIKEFFASRYIPIHNDSNLLSIFHDLFPESPYNGMLWRDIVRDAMSNYEAFVDYCRVKPFVYTYKCYRTKFGNKFKKFVPCRDELGFYTYRSNDEKIRIDRTLRFDMELPLQACFLFDLYKLSESRKQYFVSLWKQDCESKRRCWNKIENNPHLAKYLSRKNFNFRKLYRVSYHDFYKLYFNNFCENV